MEDLIYTRLKKYRTLTFVSVDLVHYVLILSQHMLGVVYQMKENPLPEKWPELLPCMTEQR